MFGDFGNIRFFLSVLKIRISGSARVRNPGHGELVLSVACSSPGCELRQGLYLNTTVLCRRYYYPFLQMRKLRLRAVKQLA